MYNEIEWKEIGDEIMYRWCQWHSIGKTKFNCFPEY